MHGDRPHKNAHNVSADFLSVRPRLFGIAYRMLGSAAEAEDIVQDAWLNWQTTDRGAVQNAPAFLATTTTRLAINHAQSARSRHEACVGSRLPDPVDTSDDPHLGAERSEALEFAVLLLLEKLTPTERAAYVLREAFDYPYDQISEILRLEEANVRQLVSRGRKHIADGRRASVSAAERKRLLAAFNEAAQKGDLASLEQLLASDATSSSRCRRYSPRDTNTSCWARAPGKNSSLRFPAIFPVTNHELIRS
jgi:RNA polymerase sigma factor (sigma-70 family)